MLKLGCLTIGLLCQTVLGDFLWVGAGANASGATSSLIMYNGSGWTAQIPLPNPTLYTNVNTFQGALYHLGGQKGGTDQNIVDKFDGTSYPVVANMLQARSNPQSVVTASPTGAPLLCAAGGQVNGGTYLSSMECFNGTTWVAGPSMTIGRASFGLVRFSGSEDNHTLCAVGGSTTGGGMLATWECLTSLSGTWQRQASGNLTLPRVSFGIAYFSEAYNGVGMICVAGGTQLVNGNNVPTNSLECTTQSNGWAVQTQSPMSITRIAAPMVKYMGVYCMVGGILGNACLASVECFDFSTKNWTVRLQDMPTVRCYHGATNYDPPTSAPTKAPSQAPSTALPTQQPTRSPTTLAPTTVAPTTSTPTTSVPTRSPTLSPTKVPTTSPTTMVPTVAPTLAGCPALGPIENGNGSCSVTPHGGSCTQKCFYGVASGSEARMCSVGVWGTLVCNSQGPPVPPTPAPAPAPVAATNNFFQAFPVASWQGIISIVAIVVVFLLCLVMIIYACWRCRRKHQAEQPPPIPLTPLPPYTPQGDVSPNHSRHSPPPSDPHAGDPFAADKDDDAVLDASAQQAAEKVRRDQSAAFERARLASEDGKHDSNRSLGYGGVSRLTVT